MKLAKLSLAAIVAAGAMTTFASAQPLEEAIKGVEFSGMLRYRLNDVKEDISGANTSTNDFDYLAKFTAPVTEDIKAVMAFASASTGGANKTGNSIRSLNVDLRKAYFVFTQNALTVKAGMQPLGTPVTDNGFNGSKGTGILATYAAGPVTVAGAYFAGATFGNAPAAIAEDSEIAALAAIGSFGPVNAQAWAIEIQSVVDLMIFAQVDGKFGPFSFVAQGINTELDSKLGGEDDYFLGAKFTYAMNNFKINAGYTTNGDDQGVYSVDGADSSVIHPGWRLGYETENVADTDTYFVDGSVSFGKVGVMAGYAGADMADVDADEFWGGVSYKVAKNFNTYVKYSDMDIDDTKDQQYFRFEAKYSF